MGSSTLQASLYKLVIIPIAGVCVDVGVACVDVDVVREVLCEL